MVLDNQLPTVLSTETVYEHSFFNLNKDQLLIPGRDNYNYFTLITAPYAVMVLAQTPDQKFVLNWEYRHPTEHVLLSCPGGIQHSDESTSACAERELLEETGYHAQNFHYRGEAFPFPGISNQKIIYFSATQAVLQQPPRREHSELIETALFSAEELRTLIRQGETPFDGLLITALFFYGFHV